MNNGTALNTTFCTLAVGDKHIAAAKGFIESLGTNDNNLLVVTDKPQEFPENINTVQFVDDLTHICQQKRFALKEAFKTYNTALFVDADTVACHNSGYYKTIYPELVKFPTIDPILQPGIDLNSSKVPVSFYLKIRPTLKPVFDGLETLLNISHENVFEVTPSAFFFTMDSEKKYQQFFEVWDQVAFWLRDNSYIISDKISMGFAAAKVNIPIREKGLGEPWISVKNALAHCLQGEWHINNFAGGT